MVRLFLVAVLWCLPFWANAAIIAQLDRNPVALGDPVVLTFTTDSVVSGEPDFAPLERDFDVRGRSQSNSFSMINGVSTISTTWELHLYPRKTGTLQIPSIVFGTDKSQALDVQVQDQPQPAAGGAPDIFIELEAEPKQPFVQQQTVITQRMFHVTPLAAQASLSHPPIESGKGNIRQIGNTRNTTMMRNGRNYQVIERRYALIPEQSGNLTLGRTTFEGILAEPGPGSFDPFDLNGKHIQRFSEPLTLHIQGQPTGYTGKHWLPASSVSLNAHWQTPADKLKAGEPVTLTLAIVADGLAAEQLPKLDIAVPAGIKAYTDQPELRNDAGNNGVVGVRQEKWVVVAPYNGEYQFPGVSVDWWNTSTGKQETARIEPVKMVVTGGAASPTGATPVPTKSSPTGTTAQPKAAVSPATGTDESWFSWSRFAAALLLIWAVLSLAWLGWLWWQKISGSPRQALAVPRKLDAKAVWKRLELACQQNQPQAAHDALVQWLDVGLNIRPALITSLREQAQPSLRVEIDALNAVLYGRSSSGWKGAALLRALQDFKPTSVASPKGSGLTTLYPD